LIDYLIKHNVPNQEQEGSLTYLHKCNIKKVGSNIAIVFCNA